MPSLTRWIECVGCGGEVGVPDGFSGQTATCPKCGALVAIDGSGPNVVQWRPARRPNPLPLACNLTRLMLPGPNDVRMAVGGWLAQPRARHRWVYCVVSPRPQTLRQHRWRVGCRPPQSSVLHRRAARHLLAQGVRRFCHHLRITRTRSGTVAAARAAESRPGTPPATAIKRATAPEIPSSASLANTPSELPAGSTIDSPEVFEHFLQEQGGPRPFKPKPDYLLGIVLTVFAAAIVAIALFACADLRELAFRARPALDGFSLSCRIAIGDRSRRPRGRGPEPVLAVALHPPAPGLRTHTPRGCRHGWFSIHRRGHGFEQSFARRAR